MLQLDNGINVSLKSYADGHVIETCQTIPDDLLESLADKRLASHSVREGEMQHVASIPAALVDRWMREGFDVFNEPVRKTVARLKAENFGHFLATDKQV